MRRGFGGVCLLLREAQTHKIAYLPLCGGGGNKRLISAPLSTLIPLQYSTRFLSSSSPSSSSPSSSSSPPVPNAKAVEEEISPEHAKEKEKEKQNRIYDSLFYSFVYSLLRFIGYVVMGLIIGSLAATHLVAIAQVIRIPSLDKRTLADLPSL